MAEVEGIQNLVAARNFLKSSLEKSKALASAIEKTGPRLEEIHQRLPALEAAFQPILVQMRALVAVRGHINRAVAPAAAVLKVFDAVHELKNSLLSNPCLDLPEYLTVMNQLEEALKFLAGNCRLAIQWLEDIAEFLEENAVITNDRYLSNLNKSLKILQELEVAMKHASLNGGLLNVAFDQLEIEFKRQLAEISVPVPKAAKVSIAPSPLPLSVIKKLEAIIERLKGKDQLENCASAYIEVRISNVKASLQALDLDYLKLSISKFDYVQIVEGSIDEWSKHLEFAVKYLLELEHKLCNELFGKIGLDFSINCFAKIVTKSGFLDFLQFGNKVTESKKDPIKLLKLLEIFSALNNLRLDFNRLFSGKACIDIQTMTRNLIKRIVYRAHKIFWELSPQVESQRQTPPPADGTVPRLVTFVTEYCNQLLGNKYKPILTHILAIHQSWKHERFHEELIIEEIRNIMKELELNLEAWSDTYDDTALSNIFMINNMWYFYTTQHNTHLGALMGDGWLRGHEQSMEYFISAYLGDSWGKLAALLSQEGQTVLSDRRETTCNLLKKRLKEFNEEFDGIQKKHSNYVLSDKRLREKICQLIIQVIVPVYRSYLQDYETLIELDTGDSKYTIYNAENLENMLSSLFQPKIWTCGSTKNTHLISQTRSAVTNRTGLALIAT
ncbi:exocyst complex component EXO70A1-like [Malania oleifera]|uniref:exocyst complex component EXO70A1-like n=1 Tax=Malania oleifera TaxID=397392 RepID=UPI0025AEB913|nr:exocyst complex component EXO70A1-like [Malania oleifera]